MNDLALTPVTFLDSKGREQQTSLVRGQRLTNKLEKFCRLIATGEKTEIESYCEAFDKTLTPDNGGSIASHMSRLLGRTDVILRVQQLRTPVIPKIAEKFEYNLNKAQEQCQMVWDLAVATGNIGMMLKAIELRSKLAKLLTEQIDVNHRHGFLDEAATAVLIDMKNQLEAVRRKRVEAKQQAAITVEAKEVATT